MPDKSARNIADQIELLKDRGMLFRDEALALHFLTNISYYRLKGYWWDMQQDRITHTFTPNTYFESVVERYNFDRHLRLILFDAVERIEIALRTKMIYHLSISYGATWYLDSNLFVEQNKHIEHINHLQREFGYSQEIFIKDHKRKHPNTNAEAWKIMEIASMGTLSKFYKKFKSSITQKITYCKRNGT